MPLEITTDVVIEKDDDSAACGVVLSTDDVVQWFGRKSRVPVIATINDHSYRTSLSPMGGAHVLPVNAGVRDAAHVKAGDRVTLHLIEDTATREVAVPDDLATALKRAKLRERFDAMSFTHRKEWVRAIDDAKRAATRAKRIADCVEKMKAR